MEQQLGGSTGMLRSPGHESSWLLLKDAHASCSPRCQNLCALLKEGSKELPQLSAAHPEGGGDTSPSLARWAHPGSCLPTAHTDNLPQPQWPNVVKPRAQWWDTHWADPRGAQDCVFILLVSASCCLWRAVANLASAFAQRSRGIPAWCWQTDPTTKRLMSYIPALHAWGSPKNPHRCSKQATTTSPFKGSGSSYVNWGTEWGFPASQ